MGVLRSWLPHLPPRSPGVHELEQEALVCSPIGSRSNVSAAFSRRRLSGYLAGLCGLKPSYPAPTLPDEALELLTPGGDDGPRGKPGGWGRGAACTWSL